MAYTSYPLSKLVLFNKLETMRIRVRLKTKISRETALPYPKSREENVLLNM
jgi:hypothetical protein